MSGSSSTPIAKSADHAIPWVWSRLAYAMWKSKYVSGYGSCLSV